MSLFEIISFIESKEMDRHATENSLNVSAVSSFQRQKKLPFNVGDKSQDAPCQRCKKLFDPFKEKRTHRYCLSCWRSQSKKVNAVQTYDDRYCSMEQNRQVMSLYAKKPIMLNNIIFDKRNLYRAKTLDHPHASIKIKKYSTNKFVMKSALADTGAQSNLWGWKNFQYAILVRMTFFLYQSQLGLLIKL